MASINKGSIVGLTRMDDTKAKEIESESDDGEGESDVPIT
jgi:hypothetical protein